MKQSGKFDYDETIRKNTERILKGFACLDRLSLAEEAGRNKGGARNVEASLLLSANERANAQEQKSVRRNSEEKILKDYADKNNLWLDFANDPCFAEGAEAFIYPSPEPGYVRKAINYKRYTDTPLSFLDNRISLHNYLFPDTAYMLIGFTTIEDFMGNNTFAFVADQPFIKGDYIDFHRDGENFKEQMRKSGFDVKVENFRPYLINKDYIVKDLHAENIIKDTDGNYLFIDTVPALNPENRQYGAGEVKNIF